MFAPGTVLLHDTLDLAAENLLFADPLRVLVAHDAAEVDAVFAAIEQANAAGLWAAGFLSYEAGFAFEERLRPLLPADPATPLAWFGLYHAPQRLDAGAVDQLLRDATTGPGNATDIFPAMDMDSYRQAFDSVQGFIAAGDTYQVNLTFKARFRLDGDPVALYRDLVRKQAVAYGALVNTGTHWLLSRSPELFIAGRNNILTARPMKGTRRRGHTLAEDEAARQALAADEKNRAENLMIVDLLRNDLGRISTIGSVAVTDLFTVETYPTLHTMTSGITARRRPDVATRDVLANLFPCGSITGAPKLRAMEIIHAVETEPRGAYTGSVGYFAPGGDFALNVAIRTAVIDNEGMGEIGIGGGVVADSTAEDEYREALLKMAFFSEPATPVTLIETMLWQRDAGFWLLDRHLDRLAQSAAYFALPCDRAAILALLHAQPFTADRMRVRLTLGTDGPAATAVELPANPPLFRFALAPDPVRSDSLWLAHKTTHRAFYDEPRIKAQAAVGVDEVLFRNERGELTEGSITNLFLQRDGMLWTPALSCGLLPGTLRAELLATGKAREAVLRLDDLERAEAIWLGNSVRGLLRAQWIKD